MSLQREMILRLQLIDEALQRITDGTYGVCRRCGQPIPDDRLEAIPFAAYDIECQEIVDREGVMNAPTSAEPLSAEQDANT
jgi:RNA polymerase-binding transcription factor DksA